MKPRAPSPAKPLPAPRNSVARALAARASSGGAGEQRRSTSAQRRADRMALQKSLGPASSAPRRGR